MLYVHEIAGRLKTLWLGSNCRTTEWLLENLKTPEILFKTYNHSFGNKKLLLQGLQPALSYGILYKVAASLCYHHPMHPLWKTIVSTSAGFKSSVNKDIPISGSKYLFLWCYSLVTNCSTGKIRKTLHFHFLVFLCLRNIVRLRNSYGELPVKMLAVIMHINFHHCLMSIFMLGRESLFTYWWEQQKDTSL